MSELERTLANQILVQAEERYLLAYGWRKECDPKPQEHQHEAKWTYNGPEERRRKKWHWITQSHAINAQKVVSREKRFEAEHKKAYEEQDRQTGNVAMTLNDLF